MSSSRWRVVALIGLLGTLACHAGAPPAPPVPGGPVVGTWRFVSGSYTQPDGSVQQVDSTRLQLLKVIGPTHFAYVTSAGPRFVRAGAGTWSLTGGKYTENLELTSVDQMRGRAYTFVCTLTGDTWHQSGMIEGTKVDEVYRRVR